MFIVSILTPGNPVQQHGGAYLLKGIVTPSPNGVDGWELNGQTQSVDDMVFGLQIRAFASSTCGAVESFSATFDAYRIVTQSDVVFTVSAGDKYFSVFSDWVCFIYFFSQKFIMIKLFSSKNEALECENVLESFHGMNFFTVLCYNINK